MGDKILFFLCMLENIIMPNSSVIADFTHKIKQSMSFFDEYCKGMTNKVSVIFLTINDFDAPFGDFTVSFTYCNKNLPMRVQDLAHIGKGCFQFTFLDMDKSCDYKNRIHFTDI